MKVELHGYQAEIMIYKSEKGYQVGALTFCRDILDIKKLKKYQEFFNEVINKLESLRDSSENMKFLKGD